MKPKSSMTLGEAAAYDQGWQDAKQLVVNYFRELARTSVRWGSPEEHADIINAMEPLT